MHPINSYYFPVQLWIVKPRLSQWANYYYGAPPSGQVLGKWKGIFWTQIEVVVKSLQVER